MVSPHLSHLRSVLYVYQELFMVEHKVVYCSSKPFIVPELRDSIEQRVPCSYVNRFSTRDNVHVERLPDLVFQSCLEVCSPLLRHMFHLPHRQPCDQAFGNLDLSLLHELSHVGERASEDLNRFYPVAPDAGPSLHFKLGQLVLDLLVTEVLDQGPLDGFHDIVFLISLLFGFSALLDLRKLVFKSLLSIHY